MKNYLVFARPAFYPYGGFNDFKSISRRRLTILHHDKQ